MRRITFVPGAVVSPAAITLPTDAPDIDTVVSAQIIRVPSALTIPNHTQAEVIAALADHPVHSHPLSVSVDAGGAGNMITVAAAKFAAPGGAGAPVVIDPGGVAGDGVRNNAAAQSHVAGGAPVAHGASVGASPVVAAGPTKLTTRTFSLDVNTVLGDLLRISYREMGDRVLVS